MGCPVPLNLSEFSLKKQLPVFLNLSGSQVGEFGTEHQGEHSRGAALGKHEGINIENVDIPAYL